MPSQPIGSGVAMNTPIPRQEPVLTRPREGERAPEAVPPAPPPGRLWMRVRQRHVQTRHDGERSHGGTPPEWRRYRRLSAVRDLREADTGGGRNGQGARSRESSALSNLTRSTTSSRGRSWPSGRVHGEQARNTARKNGSAP
jgi:hypothetical protein